MFIKGVARIGSWTDRVWCTKKSKVKGPFHSGNAVERWASLALCLGGWPGFTGSHPVDAPQRVDLGPQQTSLLSFDRQMSSFTEIAGHKPYRSGLSGLPAIGCARFPGSARWARCRWRDCWRPSGWPRSSCWSRGAQTPGVWAAGSWAVGACLQPWKGGGESWF